MEAIYSTAVVHSYYCQVSELIVQGILNPKIDCEISNNVKLAGATPINVKIFFVQQANERLQLCLWVTVDYRITTRTWNRDLWAFVITLKRGHSKA